jgi:hypothetical protein
MERAITEQSTILREQFFSNDSERGSIRATLGMAVGAVLLSGVAAGSLGAADYAIHHPVVENKIVVGGGKGMLTGVQTLAEPEACYGVYQNDVTGASADFEQTLKVPFLGKVGTTYSATSTYNGNITSQVCHDSTNLNFRYNEATKQFDLSVPASAFHTNVYRTDPTKDTLHHRNGVLMMIQRNFENEVNVIPNLNANRSDDLLGKLDGLAELAAYQTSAKACGPKAWLYLEPLYKAALQKQLVNEANRWAPQLKVKSSDINVAVTGGDINFTTQYDTQLASTKTQAQKAGVTIMVPSPNAAVCTVSPGLQKTLDQSAGTTK